MAIYTYMGCTKATTRLLVNIKVLLANISWTTGWIHIIELILQSAHQTVSYDI